MSKDEPYTYQNYVISKNVIIFPYYNEKSEQGDQLTIDIEFLRKDNEEYNKTFIKDYFDFIQNFPNEEYIKNISLFNWWFEHRSKLKYYFNGKYSNISFPRLLNKKKGGACRVPDRYTSGEVRYYVKEKIPAKEMVKQMDLLQKLDIYKGSNVVKKEELDTLIETKTIDEKERKQIEKFKKRFPNDLISLANKLREVIEVHIRDLRTTIFKPSKPNRYREIVNEEYLEPDVIPPDGWTWRESTYRIQKENEKRDYTHYYLDTLDIKKDFEIKSQFFLIKFDKEHSMYLPFPKGILSLDESIYYTKDNYDFIKKLYKNDWETIQFDIDKIEEYLNNRKSKKIWKEHFKYHLKWKRDMFIMFEILSKKGFTIIHKTIDGIRYETKGATKSTKEGDFRRHLHYDKFKSEKEGNKGKLLREKLNERMKNNYLKNIKGKIIPGKNTTLEMCKDKLDKLGPKFIKELDFYLKYKKQSKNIKITEIKDIYFENVSDFTYQTNLIKRNIKLGEVKVPCLMYPRPLKPPSWWNNTWIRCPLDIKNSIYNTREHVLGYKGDKGINEYQDKYDAWYLKDEYIENVITHYGLRDKITSLKEFERCLKTRITVNEDIDEMYPEFDEDKSEKNVVKEKKHKIIIKQEKFVKKLKDENEIIATLIVNYNSIQDIFKEVPILQYGKEMSIKQYEQALKNQEKIIDHRIVKTKDTVNLLILFLLWGNKEFNEPRYFRNTEDGKINTYGYKEIYVADNRTWSTLSKKKIKKLEKIEIGRIWYNLYQKIEEFDLLKRKDTKNNNILEGVIKQFKEKDFNKNFKSIKRELFRKIKDEAHIYLNADDKKSIINYFDYLKIHYEHLKQNLQEEEEYLKKLKRMSQDQLDKEASGVAIGSNRKKKEKPEPKITAEQEIKLYIVYNKYKGEHDYLIKKWKDFIKDATSTLFQRKGVKYKIDEDIKILKELIKEKQEDFNKNSKNYMPTEEFMNLKKKIAIKQEQCREIKEKMEKFVSKNPEIKEKLEEIEKLKKNLGIAINEHDKHRTNMKRKVTYQKMLKSHERLEEAQKKYNDEINKIPLYHLHLACEAHVEKLQDQIKTSFSQYIEKHIMKPTRLLREKEERRDWLFLLLDPTRRNKAKFSEIYKNQYRKLLKLYFNMKQIQDILIDLNYSPHRLDKLESEMKDFQTKYKRFKAEEHYFTT